MDRGSASRSGSRCVCYSIGLSQYFKRQLAGVPRQHRPAFVGSFEDLANEWGIDRPTTTATTPTSGSGTSPRGWPRWPTGLPEGKKFDAIIVDEAQDFADHWWHPLMKALKRRGGGRALRLLATRTSGSSPGSASRRCRWCPLVLDHNLRNTQQIARAFGPLAPMRMTLKGGDGPRSPSCRARATPRSRVADDQVEALLEEGWHPEHIALLTMGSRHPAQVERQEADGQVGYWRSFWESDDVFYGHVLGCKGLERRAVVLCVNTDHADRAREMLYVGMSRATDRARRRRRPRVHPVDRRRRGRQTARHLTGRAVVDGPDVRNVTMSNCSPWCCA